MKEREAVDKNGELRRVAEGLSVRRGEGKPFKLKEQCGQEQKRGYRREGRQEKAMKGVQK